MNFVKTIINDRIASIILDRPDKKNALNAEFVIELKQAFLSIQENDQVRAILLKSSGDAFCAGADLEYLQKLQKFSHDENLADSMNLAELFQIIYACPKPVISIVNGPALAGGCGLATVCDFCFATPESSFGYTESRIGFIPAIVMVFLRNKVGETTSKKLLFTGEVFKANKAFDMGLIANVYSADLLEEEVLGFVSNLIKGSSGSSIALIKEMYNSLEGKSLSESIQYACEMNAKARETQDCKSGISGFLNKEKRSW